MVADGRNLSSRHVARPGPAPSTLVVTGLFLCLLSAPSRAMGQDMPLPEYFGFYATDGDGLVAVANGSSTRRAEERLVNAVDLVGRERGEQAVRITPEVRFVLFDPAPADTFRNISLHQLPFVRNVVTEPNEVQQALGRLGGGPGPQALVDSVNAPGLVRLGELQIDLLIKPVPDEAQMLEIVPERALAPGFYGILYAPSGNSDNGWFRLVEIGQSAEATHSCVDLVYEGTGIAGGAAVSLMDIRGRYGTTFPLMPGQRYRSCGLATIAGPRGEPVAAASAVVGFAVEDPGITASCATIDACSKIASEEFLGERYGNALTLFDKILDLGGPLQFPVCRERFVGCNPGVFVLTAQGLSFVDPDGNTVYSSPLMPGLFEEAMLDARPVDGQGERSFYRFRLRVDGDAYNMVLVPSPACTPTNPPTCAEPGLTQQGVVANYIGNAIAKFSSSEE